MITTIAQVIAVEKGAVIARCQQQSSCGQCASKASCSINSINKAMPNNVFNIKVFTEQLVEVGTVIEIGIKEEMLLKSAILVYILPLIFFIFGAVGAHFFTSNEAIVIVSSLISGGLGFCFARVKAKNIEVNSSAKPCLLRIIEKAK